VLQVLKFAAIGRSEEDEALQGEEYPSIIAK
jgi:hypothetical protein